MTVFGEERVVDGEMVLDWAAADNDAVKLVLSWPSLILFRVQALNTTRVHCR